MINWMNLHLSYTCNLDCTYCFLTKESRVSSARFTRFDDLVNFLINTPLGEELVINLSSGELSLYPDLIHQAYSAIKKVERSKDVNIKFGLYTNGSNIKVILDLLDMGILDVKYTSMSWDGIYNNTTRKSSYNNDLFNSAIKTIGSSKYKDTLLIRSALTLDMLKYQEESIKYLIESGCSNWEYYFLIDNDEYRSEEFLTKFETELVKLYNYNRSGISIYNINSMQDYYKDVSNTKKLWCRSLHDSIDISIDGKVLPCGSYNSNYRYSAEATNFDDILEPYDQEKINSMNNNNCIDCEKCKYEDCKNLHCVECSRMISYRNGDTFDYKTTQSCKVRDIERKLYLKENII